MKRLVLIDSFNLLHRAFHAYPQSLTTGDGTPVNAAYGFTNLLLTIIQKLNPTHLAVAHESKEPTFRHTEYTQYKATRTWAEDHPEEAEAFYQQIPLVQTILKTLKIPVIEAPGYEADDVLGTIVNKAQNDLEIIIVSNDQDLLQLATDRIKVLRPARPPHVRETLFDAQAVKAKYGFDPIKMIEYKALRGDPSDNIPGVRGIGEKTAKDLLKEFSSVEEIYENLGKVHPPRVQKLLAESAEEAVLSKRLATIETNVPLDFDLSKCQIDNFDPEKVKRLFKKLEFNSLLKKIPGVTKEEKKTTRSKPENENQLNLI